MTVTDPDLAVDRGPNAMDVAHRSRIDLGDESVAEAVVTAVAATLDKDPMTVEPLNSAVDPDALNALFGDRMNGRSRGLDGGVFFKLDGCGVTVHSDGQVVVRE
ncbi:HalOD1 output domain-containing protein [Halorarum halobium]|uniref:HalOD1 output domain-containing protein n=1 Tax=Halorarum halobium TaxID=3075121 RepID=UPI0028A68B58|nr:HalOD1 output domain-containing protein [Halobaculum sp. XH14]